MRAIIIWEIRRRLGFLLWWSVGLGALIALTILAYLAFKDDAAQMNASLSEMTDTLGAFFGGTDLFSPVGYLSSQVYYMTLPILLIVMMVILANSLLKRDEQHGTIELILARPVSRIRVMVAKALAGVIIVLIVAIDTALVAALCIKISGLDISLGNVMLTHFVCFLFAGFFGAITFALNAYSKLTQKVAGTFAVILGVGGYIIGSLGGYIDELKHVATVFPYHYYSTTDLLDGSVNGGLIAYISVGLMVCVALSVHGYRNRDI